MYKLGQTFETIDLAKALQNEFGVFEAVSPNGETYRVECHPGSSIASLVPVSAKGNWSVTKIAESLQEEPTRARAAGAGR